MILGEILWWAANRCGELSGWLRRRSGDAQLRATGSRLTIWRREADDMLRRRHAEVDRTP